MWRVYWVCMEEETWKRGHTFFSRLLLADSSLSTSSSYSVLILCRSVSSSRRVSQYFSSMAAEEEHQKSHPAPTPEAHTHLPWLSLPSFLYFPFYLPPRPFLSIYLLPLLPPFPYSPLLSPPLLPSLLSPSPSSDCLIRAKMLISAS